MLRMPPRRKLDLEKIRAALIMQCPLCGESIPPDKQKRVDMEHMECPSFGKRFVPQGQRATWGIYRQLV